MVWNKALVPKPAVELPWCKRGNKHSQSQIAILEKRPATCFFLLLINYFSSVAQTLPINLLVMMSFDKKKCISMDKIHQTLREISPLVISNQNCTFCLNAATFKSPFNPLWLNAGLEPNGPCSYFSHVQVAKTFKPLSVPIPYFFSLHNHLTNRVRTIFTVFTCQCEWYYTFKYFGCDLWHYFVSSVRSKTWLINLEEAAWN